MVTPWTAARIGVVSLLFLVPIALPSSLAPTPSSTVDQPHTHLFLAWGPQSTHLQHVVTVVMENHDYDNFFGTYCLVGGPYCSSTGNGLAPGLCVPNDPVNPYAGCTQPFNFTAAQMNITPDLYHDWASGGLAWNHGAMNGFYKAEGRGSTPFGHYNGSTVPIYWDMAEQYAIGDNMFAANLSYSLPNHWYLIAGQSPNITQHSKLHNSSDQSIYLSQARNTSTVQDLLNGTPVSWKYYDSALAPWPYAITTVHYTGPSSAYDYWNPMASRNESYSPAFASHFVPRSDFLTDAANGSLPNISWVIPAQNVSDHPGYNETFGQSWVAQLVNAVESSPDWSSTAIFVVWDDYGGWYDHVPPPRVLTKLLSFRSPFLVISPFAKENYIGHAYIDFFSLLHFVEWQFHLGCDTALDCGASLPLSFFNFNQTARPPIFFPTVWTNATYPMTLQPISQPILCDSCHRIVPWMWPDESWFTGNESMDT
ncbi:MAG TPA: alkaline phosphatase family protein [Thermoplasmata archaeon]